jgi:hypothetical protein
MHRYRVVERWPERGFCAFRCSRGHYHLARTLNVTPEQDASLRGDKPHLGFGILVCAVSGAIFRVIFESINDTNLAAGASWTPSEPPTPKPTSTRPGFAAALRAD